MPYNIKYRTRDIDYPKESWWEVWFRDDSLICGFSTEGEAIEYRDSLNTEYQTIYGF